MESKSSILENLSKNLKLLREHYGMTQKSLSDRCGVTAQTISNIECCAYGVDIETVEKIANVFNSSVSDMITCPPTIPDIGNIGGLDDEPDTLEDKIGHVLVINRASVSVNLEALAHIMESKHDIPREWMGSLNNILLLHILEYVSFLERRNHAISVGKDEPVEKEQADVPSPEDIRKIHSATEQSADAGCPS